MSGNDICDDGYIMASPSLFLFSFECKRGSESSWVRYLTIYMYTIFAARNVEVGFIPCILVPMIQFYTF